MSLITVDLDPIAAALRAAGTDLVEVGVARDYGGATAATLVWPSGYLIPLTETAGDQLYASCGAMVAQRVTFTFGAVLALRDVRDRGGAQVMSEVPAIRAQVMTALARYRYPGADDVCLPMGGRIIRAIGKDGQLLWQDNYKITFQREIHGGS